MQTGPIVVDTNHNNHYPIHKAVLLEDISSLKCLLATNIDINNRNKDGDTPLHLAVQSNNIEILRLLMNAPSIERGAKNGKGNSALLIALSRGTQDIIRFLLHEGNVDLYEKNSFGPTLLHLAIEFFDVEIIHLMLEKGNINLHNETLGFNLLDKAFVRNKLDIFQYLLNEVKTNPIFLPFICHFFRLAVLRKKTSFVNILLEHSGLDLANLDFASFHIPLRDNIQGILDTEGEIAKKADPKDKFIPKIIFPLGYKPLHVAAAIGDEYLLRQLVEKGNAEVIALNHQGHLPLYQAAWKANLACVEYFLRMPSVDTNPLTGFSLTANANATLKKAVQCEAIDLIKLLLRFPEIRTAPLIGTYLAEHDNLILRRAARHGDLDFVNFLLEHAEVVANVTVHQNSALRAAQDNGHALVEMRLLQIPAVRDLEDLNLTFDAYNPENATGNLSRKEEGLLTSIKSYYKNNYEKFGQEAILNNFIQYLEWQYALNPAQDEAGNTLPLNPYNVAISQKPYYQHLCHTAWRYFLRPNPWILPDMPFTEELANGRAASISQRSKENLAYLWLAASADDYMAIEDFTRETIMENFACEIFYLNRAHNFDQSRMNAAGNLEQYDDLGPDRPSCALGVDRRLLQTLKGHPLREKPESRELSPFLFKNHFKEALVSQNNRYPHNFHYTLNQLTAEKIKALQDALAKEVLECEPLSDELNALFIIHPDQLHTFIEDSKIWYGANRIIDIPVAWNTISYKSYIEFAEDLANRLKRFFHFEIYNLLNSLLAAKTSKEMISSKVYLKNNSDNSKFLDNFENPNNENEEDSATPSAKRRRLSSSS